MSFDLIVFKLKTMFPLSFFDFKTTPVLTALGRLSETLFNSTKICWMNSAAFTSQKNRHGQRFNSIHQT